jgi:membrane associated rhomboid family serine protease
MLAVPIAGKISWRHPPLITIALILVNCLIYFAFQFNGSQTQKEAVVYYFDSGLAQLEVQIYLKYKSESTGKLQEPYATAFENEEEFFDLVYQMQQDEEFQQELTSGNLIHPQDADYEQWRSLRDEYEGKLASDFRFRFGFIPQKPHAVSLFSHMFLHGSVGHLLGNMAFLWLVGCMLELGCGRMLFLVIYLIGGFLAVSFFWVVNQSSQAPLIGASGAISGLMGAFAVMFGRKKVKVFFSLGFYFNYIRVTALILLPIWLGKEAYMHFFSDMRQVAYAAHFGGIAGGALLGFLIVRFTDYFKADVIQDETPDPVNGLMDQALAKISKLDLKGGRQLLEMVLAKDGTHPAALSQLFHIDKLQPQQKCFHETAARLLTSLCERPENFAKAAEVYRQYAELAGKPSLTPAMYLRMSYVFCELGELEKSERICQLLMAKRPDLPGISPTLLKIARRFRQAGRVKESRRLEQVISFHYPHSPEARLLSQG